MKKQYIVAESNPKEREAFYDYITNNYKLKITYPYTRKAFISSKFPFIVDFKEKTFWVCESITCLACASQNKRIISVNEFKKRCKRLIIML